MGKRELKEQNKNLEIHVVDLINKFDPSGTSKYTGFLTKLLQDRLKGERKIIKKGRHIRTIEDVVSEFEMPSGENYLEDVLISYLMEVYGRENMDALYSFHKHTKENRLTGKDISSYNTWDEIQKDVALATLKQNEKSLEKEVQKVFENDTWLIVRPLTFQSSLTYGSGTKWCTASRHNKEYFYRYSNNGVLCYCINKIDGDKYGLFYDIHNSEFSIWNAPDRRIDSVESSIPPDIMSNMYKFMKNEKNNYYYFSDSEKEKCDRYYREEKMGEAMPDDPIQDPDLIYENEALIRTMEYLDIQGETLEEYGYAEEVCDEEPYDEPQQENTTRW
jgi:hypothetical protein